MRRRMRQVSRVRQRPYIRETMQAIRVGTSGWHCAHWRGRFYPERLPTAAWLGFYAEHFDTVEIDATFYRLPDERTFERWAGQVPPGFRFAVKGPRTITHFRRLVGAEEAMERFLGRARLLGEHLGPILWQLSGELHVDLGRLRRFIAALPGDLVHAFEFRHPSWFAEPVYELLRAHDSPLVIWQAYDYDSPAVVTAPGVYLRYHGPGYDPGRLALVAARARSWRDEGRAVWAFFNNDGEGRAVLDATTLRDLVVPRGTR